MDDKLFLKKVLQALKNKPIVDNNKQFISAPTITKRDLIEYLIKLKD